MATRQKKRRARTKLILPMVALVVMGYFGSQALGGKYGVRSHEKLKAKTVALEYQLAEVKKRSAKLQSRINLLKDGSIERDMMDEQARIALNVVRDNEIVFMRRKSDY